MIFIFYLLYTDPQNRIYKILQYERIEITFAKQFHFSKTIFLA